LPLDRSLIFVNTWCIVDIPGCAIGSGGRTEINKPTLGQELIELKKAKDAGAISEQEYEEMKEKLKKSYE